ncbi:hypothetical protein N9V70_00990 [Candidatus Pelagibacter bacterium]|jgi:hypothetical protein|nr:hypothetical protein [Candidatus Pelagibacter bacterium]
MKIDLDADQMDAITVETLKQWHDDCLLDEENKVIISAIELVLKYGMIHKDYLEWFKSSRTV